MRGHIWYAWIMRQACAYVGLFRCMPLFWTPGSQASRHMTYDTQNMHTHVHTHTRARAHTHTHTLTHTHTHTHTTNHMFVGIWRCGWQHRRSYGGGRRAWVQPHLRPHSRGECEYRVGQTRTYTPCMTVSLVISLPKIPYIFLFTYL